MCNYQIFILFEAKEVFKAEVEMIAEYFSITTIQLFTVQEKDKLNICDLLYWSDNGVSKLS